MKCFIGFLIAMSLAACGVETASTAATSATMKKKEIDQAKNMMREAQQKIDQAAKLQQQSADKSGAEKQ